MIIEGFLSLKEWFDNLKKNFNQNYFSNIKELFKNKSDNKFIVSLNNLREYLKTLEEILSRKKSPPDNILEEYINLSKKKVKLILERRFYKSLYNLIQKNSEEIEGKILKILFQGIENKYSPEKCLISL